MAKDQETFKRASNATLLGMTAQFGFALLLLVLWLWADSPSMTAAVWHFFGGLPIWIILLLIYNQHRIERVESFESEQIAQRDATAAALFDEHADELSATRKRLARLYKWGLSITSVLVAVYLLVVGSILFYAKYQQYQARTLGDNLLSSRVLENEGMGGVLTGVTIGLALTLFLLARYIAGMTKVNEWQLLRGGASYLMGNALVVLLIAIGAAEFAWGSTMYVLVYLQLVVPALLLLIGTEILLTFLLSAYRPRKAGEVPRPAFDSRLLGLLTSPESLGRIVSETLNYQFGIEISRSWFYRLLARAIAPLIAVTVLALIAMTSIVVVEPHQEAVITRMGTIRAYDAENDRVSFPPGMHFKLPWPLSSAEKFSVNRVQQITIGSAQVKKRDDQGRPIEVALLWTDAHIDGKERYLVTAARDRSAILQNVDAAVKEEIADVQNLALLAAEIIVQYQIEDLGAYVQSAASPVDLLTAVADQVVSHYFASHDINDLLVDQRDRASRELRQRLQQKVDENGLNMGIRIVFVGLSGMHPPTANQVAASYHNQINALQEKESTIQIATREATEMLAEVAGSPAIARQIDAAIKELDRLKDSQADAQTIAEAENEVKRLFETRAQGQASTVIAQARAYRWTQPLSVAGEAQRFSAQLLAYRAAPDYYVSRTYYQALANVLPQSRRYIFGMQAEVPGVIQIDLQDHSAGITGILRDE